MNASRLADYLTHIGNAAEAARQYAAGMSRDEFGTDQRTQQAVIFNLLIIGEAANKVLTRYPEFAERHSELPWHAMKGMRNRIAHGYFDINLDVVWATVQTALPDLQKLLGSALNDASSGTTDA